ncbi:MAG: glycosyltransferase family A protein [bacterium]|nr:glycosyltransferase family A protein [bacterium]
MSFPFSVLIPTYNRCDKLQKVLETLFRQEGIEVGEVIVGVDGSTDSTLEMLQDLNPLVSFSFFRIANSGRSVIRNRLLDAARGDLILFIQDDILVDQGWLQAHLAAQRKREGAVVGHVTWYPGMEISEYMKWLENGGHMLRFGDLRDGDQIDFWRFYMGNISFPRNFLGGQRFDETIRSYGWEDIVFGHEFERLGHPIFYSAGARAFHWDEYREEDLRAYMQQVGESAFLAEQRCPGVGFVPPLWKKMVFYFLIGAGRVTRPLLPQRWRWYLDMKRWFLEACASSHSQGLLPQ